MFLNEKNFKFTLYLWKKWYQFKIVNMIFWVYFKGIFQICFNWVVWREGPVKR